MQRLSIKPWHTHHVNLYGLNFYFEELKCELMWIRTLLKELKFVVKVPMTMHCDNQAAIHIASNLVFHERIKHIEADCHIT